MIFSPHLCKVSYRMLLFWTTQSWPDLLKDKKTLLIDFVILFLQTTAVVQLLLTSQSTAGVIHRSFHNELSKHRGRGCGMSSHLPGKSAGVGRAGLSVSPGSNPYLLTFTFSSACHFGRACSECLRRTFVFRVLDSRGKPD